MDYFVHFPKLVIPEQGIDLLGGRLERLRYDDFEAMDSDWARKSFFEATEPTVWRYTTTDVVPTHMPSHIIGTNTISCINKDDAEWCRIRGLGMLIYYALLIAVPKLYPDPRMSVSYAQRQGRTYRLIGPYDRTFLLNRSKFDPLSNDQMADIATRVTAWVSGGLSHFSKVFGPLRGLSLLGSGTLSPIIGVAPLIVSLEGYLLGRKVSDGITAAMTRQIHSIIGVSASEGLHNHVRQLYAWRSDILHGRAITDNDIQGLFDRLCWLIRMIVQCGIQRALDRQSDGNDLEVIRAEGLNLNA